MQIQTGIDIIEVQRIKEAIEKQGEIFLKKVYTENEINYCENKGKMTFQHYAARFAAKEAVYKAISDKISKNANDILRKIEIINNEKGKPIVNLERLKITNIESMDLSISHIREFAIANFSIIYNDKKILRKVIKNMRLFDTHAHYNDEKFDEDREEILKKVFESGVTNLNCVGYNIPSSKKAIEVAEKFEQINAIIGISPNDLPSFENENIDIKDFFFEDVLKEQLNEIKNLANKHKIVAIGEIGLDYYWNKENKKEQKMAFRKQIEIANELNLPIVILTRYAIFDTIEIRKNKIMPVKKGIFHCCPLNQQLIKEGLELGFYISFAGPITFKNSKNAEEVISMVPLDKILIETDCPYYHLNQREAQEMILQILYILQKKLQK